MKRRFVRTIRKPIETTEKCGESVRECGTCVPVRIGPLSKIAIRKGRSARGERGGGERTRKRGHSSLETSIPIFRGYERRMSTSRARRRFLSANAMKCVSLFSPPLTPPALSRKHLRTWPVCRAAFYLERLEKKKKKKISGRPDALSPDYRDRSSSGEKSVRKIVSFFREPPTPISKPLFRAATNVFPAMVYNSLLLRRSFDSDPNLT